MKKYIPLRIGKGSISLLLDKRALTITSLFAAGALLVFIASLSLGEEIMNPMRVVKTLFGYGDELDILIVQSFRLPRILVALLVGICLAIAGAILQGIIRNPLASPDVIGVTGGASVTVVLFLYVFSDANNALTVSIKWMPVAAVIGAVAMGLIVYILSWKGRSSTFLLVLIGIGLSMLAQSLTTLLMIKSSIYQASQANVWLTGSVSKATWEQVHILLPLTIILCVFCIIVIRKVNVQQLDEDLAMGVGSNVQKNQLLLLMLGTACAGIAVAFGGNIGFVGLMAPHIARRLVGSSFGALLPVTACIGGLLVMLSDLAGRIIFSPLEVPAGVFTAAIGAPYFIYILYKTRNS